MTKIQARLLLPALAVLGGTAGAARADSPCQSSATPPPAVTETVTCAEAAISRFFLISPAMASLAADQRAAVVAQPLRYAFAYMKADAINRLQQGFADKSVQSIDYKTILTTSDGKGSAPAPHRMFTLRMDRAAAEKTDWKSLAPSDLFKLGPSHLSRWLSSGLAAETARVK
jgi:hypothetical protein